MEGLDENAVPETTETAQPKSANELFAERIKAKYPERDYSNPDEVHNASMEGYDAEHERLKKVIESNKAIADRMMADPKAAAALSEFMSGKPLPAALKKYFTDDELSMNEGEDGYAEYLAAQQERALKDAESKQAQQEFADNFEKSHEEIAAYAEETGRTEEEMTQFLDDVQKTFFDPLLKGQWGKAFLVMCDKAMSHDKDVEVAQEVGRVSGKNEKIVDRKKERTAGGLPDAGAGGGAANAAIAAKPTETGQFFNKLADAGAEKDIWKRGGYGKKA